MSTYIDALSPGIGAATRTIGHLTRNHAFFRRLGAGVYLMTATRVPGKTLELEAVASMLSVSPSSRRHFTGWADVLPPGSGRW
jgi:hypothetical protein